jgi:hypothetical protein
MQASELASWRDCPLAHAVPKNQFESITLYWYYRTMSSRTHQIITRRTFQYASIAASTGTVSTTMVKYFDVSNYTSVDLVARLHSATIPTSSTFKIEVFQVSRDADNPSADFIGDSVGNISWDNNDDNAAPKTEVTRLTTPYGSALLFKVTAGNTHGSLAQSVVAEVSVDVVCRET